jgi:cobalt-zinc-cadmium efflux system outer membrane protein
MQMWRSRAVKRPDFGVEVAYQRRDPRFGDYVSAGVTVSLPLFAKHRQDPLISAANSRASAVRAEQVATRQALNAELDAGLADHVMHHEQWMRARNTLQPARRRAGCTRNCQLWCGAGESDGCC